MSPPEESIVERVDRMLAAMKAAEQVTCPHCGWELDPGDAGEYGLVTYCADDGPVEIECEKCNTPLLIEEHVERTYTVTKTSPA